MPSRTRMEETCQKDIKKDITKPSKSNSENILIILINIERNMACETKRITGLKVYNCL